MNRQDHDASHSGKRWMKHARHLGAVASSEGPHATALRYGDASDLVDTTSSGSDGWVASIRRSAREFLAGSDDSPSRRPVLLDGSSVESGITILTTALPLSMITGRPFQIHAFREPGLQLEELGLIKAAASLCEAKLIGNVTGSRVLSFRPSACSPRDLSINLGTTGSASLLTKILHLPLALKARRASRLTVLGGMNSIFVVSDESWRGQMAKLGAPVALAMPASGRVEAWIEPATLRPVDWTTRGRLLKFQGVAEARGEVAGHLKAMVECRLRSEGIDAEVEINALKATSTRTSFQLTATHDNGPKNPSKTTFLGIAEPGAPPEKAANDAVDAFLRFERTADAAIDPNAAVPLLVALALTEGRSVFSVSEVSQPLRATVETLRAFLPDRLITLRESTDGTAAARVSIS